MWQPLPVVIINKCLAERYTVCYDLSRKGGAGFMAIKSSNVMARVEPEIKEKAEEILSQLGISASGGINMFYRQIILWNGLPFRPSAAYSVSLKHRVCMYSDSGAL